MRSKEHKNCAVPPTLALEVKGQGHMSPKSKHFQGSS